MRSFKTPLQRLVAQSVTIQRVKADCILNSKSEWGSSRIPHLRVEVRDKQMEAEDDRYQKANNLSGNKQRTGSTNSVYSNSTTTAYYGT